jgi:hypothetical protein
MSTDDFEPAGKVGDTVTFGVKPSANPASGWEAGEPLLKRGDTITLHGVYTDYGTPLHVLVANAIGWTELRHYDDLTVPGWYGRFPGAEPGIKTDVPRYDSSFCSTGPLMERFKIGVMWDHGQWIAHYSTTEGHDQYQGGETPSQAVSRMVVHLHKKGLLTE